MKISLTPVQNRSLALFLLFLAVAAVFIAIALPTWWLHKRYDSSLEDYSDRLTRYRRVAALRPAIMEAIAATEKLDGRKYYLKSATPTLAAAELQGLVTKIVEAQGGRIMSSQAIPAKEEGKTSGSGKIAFSIQMGTAIIPLQLILHALETNEPYLFIDQLTIRSNLGRGYRPVPGVQPEFNVQLTVSGYSLAGGTKK